MELNFGVRSLIWLMNESGQKALGKAPNHTEVVLLFVAKTTWHEPYARVFPLVDGYEDTVRDKTVSMF
jgi:hypothetical protein